MDKYDFKLIAPAKINYYLKILGLRKDGYHDIVTVFQTISLYDQLSFAESPRKIEVVTDDEELQDTEGNLVFQAAELLRKVKKVEKGARIFLEKSIPKGSGLGGGSSDAAYTLKGLNRLWNLKLSDDDLLKMSGKLGADVSFFLKGGVAVGKGKGDRIYPVSVGMKPRLPILLVCPPFKVSSKEAYAMWDKAAIPSMAKGPDEFMRALYTRSFSGITDHLFNDFEPVISKQYPVIGQIKNLLLEKGAQAALMTGSGSVVYGIFRDEASIDRVKDNFTQFGEIIKATTV